MGISRGADVEALDTYGFTPLARMASNNLAVGAQALIDAGADPTSAHARGSPRPVDIARESRAASAIGVLQAQGKRRKNGPTTEIRNILVLQGGGSRQTSFCSVLEGRYARKSATEVPKGFADVCESNGWAIEATWQKLNADAAWFQATHNESYIYFNTGDKHWWIDGPDGLGVWKAPGPSHAPPARGWACLREGCENLPQPAIAILRGSDESSSPS